MSALGTAMRYYPYVVHPITVLGASIAVLIHHEWARQDAPDDALWRRLAAFLGAGLLALVPTVAFYLVTGASVAKSTQGNSFTMDALVASGLFVAAGVTWYLWRRYDWGRLIPGMMQSLAAVTVPYVALSPYWNVSGHVVIALMPTLYLTLVDRKFWPTLVLPAVMVYNRIYLGAHTVAQTLAAVPIAAGIVLALYWLGTDGSLRPGPESTAL